MITQIKLISTSQIRASIAFFESLGYKCHEMWKGANSLEDILSKFPFLVIHKDSKVIHFNQGEFGRATEFEY